MKLPPPINDNCTMIEWLVIYTPLPFQRAVPHFALTFGPYDDEHYAKLKEWGDVRRKVEAGWR